MGRGRGRRRAVCFRAPGNPSRITGFEVDLANAIARELGVPKARQSQNAWDSLIPALERGDFDFAMNGIEITQKRKEKLTVSACLIMSTPNSL